jgi:Skp family chaperone for outer membrane proteins
MKSAIVCIAFAAVLGLPLWGQQVTMVAVCNWTQVLTTSYKESQAVRELEDFRVAYQKEVQSVSRDISDLENQKLDADKAGNKDASLQLEKKINDKKAYLDDYQRIKKEAYKRQADKILSTSIVKEILDAVHYVAERDGYALVLRSDGAYADLILANIPEIDITTKVIKRLYELAGKTYTGGD